MFDWGAQPECLSRVEHRPLGPQRVDSNPWLSARKRTFDRCPRQRPQGSCVRFWLPV